MSIDAKKNSSFSHEYRVALVRRLRLTLQGLNLRGKTVPDFNIKVNNLVLMSQLKHMP